MQQWMIGAPEITPQMIEAGHARLCELEGCARDYVAREVFLAMIGAVGTHSAGLLNWRQCYGDLWKLKLAFEKQHNR